LNVSVPFWGNLPAERPVNTGFNFFWRSLLACKKQLDILQVGLVDFPEISKIPFALGALLSQDVALESMFPPDLPCSGESKSLFCTGISLHFWHRL